MIKCSRCREIKPSGSFSAEKCRPGKTRRYCSRCCADLQHLYYISHKKSVATYNREYTKRRRQEDVNFRVASNIRSRVHDAILSKNKVGSAVKDLGCSIGQFRLYIENQFVDGMSWDNYGEWHLDHVMPLSSFNLEDRSEFLTACNWLNYQPLWATDNLRKGNRA